MYWDVKIAPRFTRWKVLGSVHIWCSLGSNVNTPSYFQVTTPKFLFFQFSVSFVIIITIIIIIINTIIIIIIIIIIVIIIIIIIIIIVVVIIAFINN